MSSGVVPDRKTSLWPDALSNGGANSLSRAAMAPPARTLMSAACTLAIGDNPSVRASIEAAAMSHGCLMHPPFEDTSLTFWADGRARRRRRREGATYAVLR